MSQRSFTVRTAPKSFLEYLENLVMVEADEARDVIVVSHNFKGYDSMFILQQLFKEHRTVTDQINVSTNVLSLRTGYLKFIDSLCFLPFPLASFPATFGLEELRKGFFPHFFNTFYIYIYILFIVGHYY